MIAAAKKEDLGLRAFVHSLVGSKEFYTK